MDYKYHYLLTAFRKSVSNNFHKVRGPLFIPEWWKFSTQKKIIKLLLWLMYSSSHSWSPTTVSVSLLLSSIISIVVSSCTHSPSSFCCSLPLLSRAWSTLTSTIAAKSLLTLTLGVLSARLSQIWPAARSIIVIWMIKKLLVCHLYIKHLPLGVCLS